MSPVRVVAVVVGWWSLEALELRRIVCRVRQIAAFRIQEKWYLFVNILHLLDHTILTWSVSALCWSSNVYNRSEILPNHDNFKLEHLYKSSPIFVYVVLYFFSNYAPICPDMFIPKYFSVNSISWKGSKLLCSIAWDNEEWGPLIVKTTLSEYL